MGELKEKHVNPYPHKFQRTLSIPEFVNEFSSVAHGEHLKEKSVSVAGRSRYSLTSCILPVVAVWRRVMQRFSEGSIAATASDGGVHS